jgi:hypothetical protein
VQHQQREKGDSVADAYKTPATLVEQIRDSHHVDVAALPSHGDGHAFSHAFDAMIIHEPATKSATPHYTKPTSHSSNLTVPPGENNKQADPSPTGKLKPTNTAPAALLQVSTMSPAHSKQRLPSRELKPLAQAHPSGGAQPWPPAPSYPQHAELTLLRILEPRAFPRSEEEVQRAGLLPDAMGLRSVPLCDGRRLERQQSAAPDLREPRLLETTRQQCPVMGQRGVQQPRSAPKQSHQLRDQQFVPQLQIHVQVPVFPPQQYDQQGHTSVHPFHQHKPHPKSAPVQPSQWRHSVSQPGRASPLACQPQQSLIQDTSVHVMPQPTFQNAYQTQPKVLRPSMHVYHPGSKHENPANHTFKTCNQRFDVVAMKRAAANGSLSASQARCLMSLGYRWTEEEVAWQQNLEKIRALPSRIQSQRANGQATTDACEQFLDHCQNWMVSFCRLHSNE